MATAKVIDGVAIVGYVNGVAVDSEGKEVKGAPKQPKDTDPSLQPGAVGAPTPEERMAIAIATAVLNPKAVAGSAKSAARADEDEDEDEARPSLADLPDHLAGLTSASEVKALQKADERVGAVRHYEARLAELSGE